MTYQGTVHLDAISEEEALQIQQEEVALYKYRGGLLRRAPKMEWFRREPLRYSWGQARSNDVYSRKFPDWMEAIAARLEEPVNHAIIIKYDHGEKTHAPWHSDKCQELGRRSGCMRRGTGFYVFSVGTPRLFQLGHPDKIVWQRALPHRSLVHIDAETNAKWKHCVPPQADWHGCRWSLIFRTIVEPTVEVPVCADPSSPRNKRVVRQSKRKREDSPEPAPHASA